MKVMLLVLVLVGLPVASALVDVDGARAQAGELTIETILDKWAQALGGRDKLAATGTMKFTIKAKMAGMDGNLLVWSTDEGQQRTELNLGGIFNIVQVFDRDHGWVKDQNGKVSEISGQQLKGEITGAYIGSWSHLLPGRRPGEVEYLGPEEGTGLLTVRISPEGGETATYYLDPDTYLPVRSERAAGDRTSVTTYSDWKDIDGILYAGRFTQSEGNAQFDANFELVSVETHQTAPANAFGKPGEEADDVVFSAGNKAVGIPIELNGVHIFVQVRVNGSEPMWFILDTGAAVTVIDTETAKEMGLDLKGEIEARGAGEGSQQASFIADMSYEVGGVNLMHQRGTAIPLRMLEPMFGRQIDGILGYDFISRFAMTIDYDNSELNLFDRNSYEYAGEGTVVPIRLEHGNPHVTATVTPFGKSPIEADFLVDSGAGMSVGFTTPFVEKNKLLSTLPKKFYFEGGGGVGGKMTSYIGRVKQFQIADLTFDDLICGFSQDTGGAGANPDLAGIIGGEVLKCFTVTFDYEHNRMIFEPGQNYGQPMDQNLAGLSFKTGGRGKWHEISVRYVQEKSPGAKAGIETGDKVLSFDGIPAADLTLAQLERMVKENPRTVEIVIERDGKEMKKKIKLEPMV